MSGPWHVNARTFAGVALYLALYLALDWISLIHPFGALGITPWNPPAGLSFALFLHYGFGFAPAAFAAVVLADLLFRDLSAAPLATLASALIIALGYASAAWILRVRIGMSLRLSTQRDLLWLLGIALAAPALIALPVVSAFAVAELLAWSDAAEAALHFWVGDVIGIAVLTPFLLLMADAGQRRRTLRRRNLLPYIAELALIALALWIIFGRETTDNFEYSYVLLLPLIWIALRSGLAGATWGIVATQIGLVLAIELKGHGADILADFQLLMLAVAVTGLILGGAVDERVRAVLRLREHEADLAQAARLTVTGEVAASLAHELNQPLTAFISFARACQSLLQSPSASEEQHREAARLIDRAVQQATRAGEIVRTTREFLRGGDMTNIAVTPAQIVHAVLDLMHAKTQRHHVHVTVDVNPTAQPVFADPIQIEQVLVNLMRNSVEAMDAIPQDAREIVVTVTPAAQPNMVEFTVRDRGPGFSPDMAERLFKPFASTKKSGMGLGLSISRSIIEAHGGRIQAVPSPNGNGAEIRFTLPVYTEENNDV